MKKYVVILLSLIFLLGLSGCGKSNKQKESAADKHFLQDGSYDPGDNTGVGLIGASKPKPSKGKSKINVGEQNK